MKLNDAVFGLLFEARGTPRSSFESLLVGKSLKVLPGDEKLCEIDVADLDKFHPESQVTRRFKLESIQESTKGKLLLCSVDFNVRLEEGLPTLTGKGEMEFDLESGGPISANLEVEGRFVSPVSEKTVDSQTTSSVPLRLKERLSLRFSN